MNTDVMFSRKTDEWSTPDELWNQLDAEFDFWLDAAATRDNTKTAAYLGPDQIMPMLRDALSVDWWGLTRGSTIWLNPPYSQCREFMAKCEQERRKGCTIVALVPSRTDTRWWHETVWDQRTNQPRPGIQVRFIKGRLKFGGAPAGAPFPSAVIVFRPEF